MQNLTIKKITGVELHIAPKPPNKMFFSNIIFNILKIKLKKEDPKSKGIIDLKAKAQ